MTTNWLSRKLGRPLASPRLHAGLILACAFSLLASACGSATDSGPQPPADHAAQQTPAPTDQAPTPDPGPRYFPAPSGRFFDGDDIVAVNPDVSKRKPMILKDNVYWLDDADAHSLISYSLDKLVFPLKGHRKLLGYKPGMIVANKFAMIRHYIKAVHVENDRIIWDTRPAKMGEVVKEGNFYIDIKPGAEVPLGFDALDPYLYASPKEELDDIRKHLNSRLVRLNIKSLRDQERFMSKQMLAAPDSSGSSEYRTRTQALTCSFPDAGGNDLYNCDKYIRQNPGDYMPNGSDHSQCITAGNWKYEPTCKNDITRHRYAYMPDPNNPDDPNAGCIAAGHTKNDANGDPICICDGLSPQDCIAQQCDQICECDTGTVDDCSFHVCKDKCGYDKQSSTQESGGSSSSDGMGGSLSFCLNTDTNPNDPNRCPGTIPIKIDKGYQLGPNVLNLTLKPIFMATVGIKASFDFDISCCIDIDAVAKIGVYGGVGYGLNAAINVANVGASGGDDMTKYWSDITGSPLAHIPVWILDLQLDPYIRMQFHGEGGLGGQLAYEYYDEHWFYACVWFGTSNGAEFKVDDPDAGSTITRCNLPNHSRDASVNGFLNNGFNAEVGLGVSLALGLELNLYGRHRTGVWFEPIRALADLNASLRAPRCSWDYYIRFGALFGIGVDLGIISFRKEWTWIWQFLPAIFGEGEFTGGIWKDIFGCGLYDTVEPYTGDHVECPVGPAGDQQCTDDLGAPARCFVRECVKTGPVRVSLGWYTPGADLDLYVRDANGTTFSANNSYPGDFTRHSCGGACGTQPSSARFIENAVIAHPINGEYQIWVVMTPNSTVTQPVPFTIEVETGDTRQTFSGTVDPNNSYSSPTVFTVPVSN